MLIFKEIIYQGVNAGQLPARTNAAREWYRDAAEQISAPNRLTPSKVVRSFEKKRKVGTLTPGYMYLFKYDPLYHSGFN